MKQKNQIKKTKKVCLPARQGFTLVESMVTVFVFSLAAVMIVGTFSSFFKNYQVVRNLQKNTESAQYVMNLMAKTIRTSTIKNVTTNQIQMYDNSSSSCVIYKYDTVTHKMMYNATPAANIDACVWTVGLAELSSGDSSGNIQNAYFTNLTTTGVGRITMALSVKGGATNFPIQTSVSLRNDVAVPTPPTPTCTHDCSAWSACSSSSRQTCTAETLSPSGCTGGTSVIGTTRSCTATCTWQDCDKPVAHRCQRYLFLFGDIILDFAPGNLTCSGSPAVTDYIGMTPWTFSAYDDSSSPALTGTSEAQISAKNSTDCNAKYPTIPYKTGSSCFLYTATPPIFGSYRVDNGAKPPGCYNDNNYTCYITETVTNGCCK